MGSRRSFRLEDIPSDLGDAAFKIVVHWKDFASLRTREAALDLLRQQVPAASDEERTAMFDAVVLVHDHAVDAVPRHVRRRPFKLFPSFASRRDIDEGACMAELNDIAPTLPSQMKKDMLGWVIHWHWER